MAGASIRRLAQNMGILISRANPINVPALRLVQELARRDIHLILDIGANDGGYASEIYRYGYLGELVSFEPLPLPREKLLKLSSRYPGWKVAPPLALSNSAGTEIFYEAANSASSSLMKMTNIHVDAAPETSTARSFEVKTAKLDDLSQDLQLHQRHFMKIDTQGSEELVLQGARDTLNYADGIQIELSLHPLYDDQMLWREMDNRLKESGYELWDIVPGFRHRQTAQLMQFDGIYFRR